MSVHPNKPRRLSEIYQYYIPPLYFVTFCTWNRKACLCDDRIHTAFAAYARKNIGRGIVVGRYIIMPEHIHMFVRGPYDFKLSTFMRLLKQSLSFELKDMQLSLPFWQPGFFDHLIRGGESYSEKWEYVRQNPVRAKLVSRSEDWLYQGEIGRIDRV